MQIGARIRDHRTQADMSQDDLAMRVYVSRQTISSWENDKTYPDVQSLLLLSEIFDTSIDDLIKGDVETMTSTLDSDATTMKRLGYTMLGFLALMLLALVWLTVQLVVWDWHLPRRCLPSCSHSCYGASRCSQPFGRIASKRSMTS